MQRQAENRRGTTIPLGKPTRQILVLDLSQQANHQLKRSSSPIELLILAQFELNPLNLNSQVLTTAATSTSR